MQRLLRGIIIDGMAEDRDEDIHFDDCVMPVNSAPCGWPVPQKGGGRALRAKPPGPPAPAAWDVPSLDDSGPKVKAG